MANIASSIGKFLKNMLSSSSEVSSKRVSGMLALIISLACIVYLTIDEGGSTTVESLIQTTLIMSSCLLGVSSVTSIWKVERTVKSDETINKDVNVEKTEKKI
jgi:hypothetical protein